MTLIKVNCGWVTEKDREILLKWAGVKEIEAKADVPFNFISIPKIEHDGREFSGEGIWDN